MIVMDECFFCVFIFYSLNFYYPSVHLYSLQCIDIMRFSQVKSKKRPVYEKLSFFFENSVRFYGHAGRILVILQKNVDR